MCLLCSQDGHDFNRECAWSYEEIYQAFKARLLEEVVAEKIEEVPCAGSDGIQMPGAETIQHFKLVATPKEKPRTEK